MSTVIKYPVGPITPSRKAALKAYAQQHYGVVVLPFGDGSITRAALALVGVEGFFADIFGAVEDLLTRNIAGLALASFAFLRDDLTPERWACALGHELSHTRRQRENLLRWLEQYMLDAEFRAVEESGAYATENEIAFALGLGLPPIGQTARIDHGYLLPAAEVQFGNLLTEQDITSIEHGIISQPVARDIIALLEAIPP